MSIRVVRALLFGCSAALALCDRQAQAQETLELPQIQVTAPRRVVRRAPPKPPADAVPVTPAGTPLLGALPVVTDRFATVTVVPIEEIKRSGGGTLGDLLFSKPGITGSSFAPGAASRPIVRGLDMHRVRVQENGIGTHDVSNLSVILGATITLFVLAVIRMAGLVRRQQQSADRERALRQAGASLVTATNRSARFSASGPIFSTTSSARKTGSAAASWPGAFATAGCSLPAMPRICGCPTPAMA